MTEEENKAIEDLKEEIEYYKEKYFTSKDDKEYNDKIFYSIKLSVKDSETLLNLIEKLQKENEEYKLLNANIEKANKIIEGKEEYIPKDKIRKLEDMWNDNIWNATDDESKAKAEMIRDVYRGLLNE